MNKEYCYVNVSELNYCDCGIYLDEIVSNDDVILYDCYNEYKNYNDELIKDIIKCFDEYNCYGIYGFDSVKDMLNYYIPKSNKKSWSGKEVKQFLDLVNEYNNVSYKRDELDSIVKVLEIVTQKKYETHELRGYSQGEVTMLITSENYDDEMIQLINNLFFGGCYEALISFSEKNIEELTKENIDVFEECDETLLLSDTYAWSKNKLKEKVAKNYNIDVNDILIIDVKHIPVKYQVSYEEQEL